MNPGPLCAPPDSLANLHLDVVDFDKSFFRSHGILRHPIFYGKTKRFRFDAPDGSFGVLYAAADPYAAFAESLIKNPQNRVVTTSELKNTAIAKLKAKEPLRLIDLTPSGALMRIGADSRLFSGDREIAQLWSKALHDHRTRADGILYPSRLDPVRQSIALFGDRGLKLIELDRQVWYAPGPQRDLLATIAEHYKVELIENKLIPPRKPSKGITSTAPGVLDL